MIKTMTLAAACAAAMLTSSFANERIITTSAYITQVVEALGKAPELVGADTTSRYNDDLKALPDVGYRIALSTEGMLSLKPTWVLWSSDSGPQATIDQVNGSGVKHLTVKKPVNMAELKTMVSQIGEALDTASQSEVINAELEEKHQTLQKAIAARGEKKALFIMNEMGQGKNGSSQNFAGNDTSANALIELLGMDNPFAKQFSAYKAVNVETQIQQGADIVFIGKRYDGKTEVPPIVRLDSAALGWPAPVAPKCVYEVDISHMLVYGIHLYDDALALNGLVNECLEEE
ncbi:heme/hemin ABC transporter substrate-binding protein [Wohlfahrtiimonas chitiniclastica]|nr:ABC transporter substrate-binding protein [Wohlfahrtiimonas chitiniclastica]